MASTLPRVKPAENAGRCAGKWPKKHGGQRRTRRTPLLRPACVPGVLTRDPIVQKKTGPGENKRQAPNLRILWRSH